MFSKRAEERRASLATIDNSYILKTRKVKQEEEELIWECIHTDKSCERRLSLKWTVLNQSGRPWDTTGRSTEIKLDGPKNFGSLRPFFFILQDRQLSLLKVFRPSTLTFLDRPLWHLLTVKVYLLIHSDHDRPLRPKIVTKAQMTVQFVSETSIFTSLDRLI